ncbi:MAG: hypothetical protein J2P37_34035, partial [Ktedonobacteraceae bacterium]|nr:hypothetical protein [Ktedonobacteraceae bacterium]
MSGHPSRVAGGRLAIAVPFAPLVPWEFLKLHAGGRGQLPGHLPAIPPPTAPYNHSPSGCAP